MYNSQCPHRLVPVANHILKAYNSSLLLHNRSSEFRQGFFAAALALILRDKFPTLPPTEPKSAPTEKDQTS